MKKTPRPFTGKHFAVMYLCCTMFFAPDIRAQRNNVNIRWGLASPVAFKVQLLPAHASTYEAWGNTAFCVVTVIEGTDDQTLSILNKLGYALDFTTYGENGAGSLLMERGSLFCNPEIMFPTRMKRLKVTAGIGLEWNGYFLLQSDFGNDQDIQSEVDQKRRTLFPYLSAGLYYDLKNDFHLQLFVRQMITGYFTKEAQVFLSQTTQTPDLILNDKPTFFGLAVSYFFHR